MSDKIRNTNLAFETMRHMLLARKHRFKGKDAAFILEEVLEALRLNTAQVVPETFFRKVEQFAKDRPEYGIPFSEPEPADDDPWFPVEPVPVRILTQKAASRLGAPLLLRGDDGNYYVGRFDHVSFSYVIGAAPDPEALRITHSMCFPRVAEGNGDDV